MMLVEYEVYGYIAQWKKYDEWQRWMGRAKYCTTSRDLGVDRHGRVESKKKKKTEKLLRKPVLVTVPASCCSEIA